MGDHRPLPPQWAVLEGVAFSMRDCLDALARPGTRIAEADVIGGGSRSRTWTQSLAAVLGIPLHRLAGGEQGGRTGEDPAAICLPPRRVETIQPDAALTDAIQARLHRYRELYPALSRTDVR